jgi:hypothetical protein
MILQQLLFPLIKRHCSETGCDMLRQLVPRQGLSLSLFHYEGHTICVALEIRPWIDAESHVFIHLMAFWSLGDLAYGQDCDAFM